MYRIKLTTALFMFAAIVTAQEKMPNAIASSPDSTKYMQGFPPPSDKRINARDGSFFQFPAIRYSVVHMREFMPTVNVPRGNTVCPTEFTYAIDNNIDSITFTPLGGDSTVTWKESLALNYTDGILILHKGRIVYERYFGELTPERVHAVMSVTKSFTGTLASILVAEGELDTGKYVGEYIPELNNSHKIQRGLQ